MCFLLLEYYFESSHPDVGSPLELKRLKGVFVCSSLSFLPFCQLSRPFEPALLAPSSLRLNALKSLFYFHSLRQLQVSKYPFDHFSGLLYLLRLYAHITFHCECYVRMSGYRRKCFNVNACRFKISNIRVP